MGGGPSGGGTQVGQATGSIVINTQSVLAAQQVVANASRAMSQSLASINASTNQAQQGIGGFASAFSQLGGAVGVTLSLATAMRALDAVVRSSQLATSFDRQSVAAENLAGSQAKLNQLLEVYESATGGVIGKAQALSDVTRLLSVGFADSAQELDQFVRAVRGISIATGRPQEFVVTQLQLELLNQTGFRLDQVGLGMEEVRQRAAALQAANSNLTKEQAYQNAVLEVANQKFGDLTSSAVAQATGLEKLAKAWNDLGLQIGQVAQGPLDLLGKGAALFIDAQTLRLRAWMNELDVYIRLLRQMGMAGPWLTSGERSFVGGSVGRDVGRHRGGGGTPSVPDFTERNKAIGDYFRDVADIERDAANDRLDATRDYESQRSSTISDYEQTIAREAQDFAISRTRSEQQFQRQINQIYIDGHKREMEAAQDLADNIARLRADAGRQEARWQRDLDRSLADARQDSAKRIADATRDHDERLADAREDSDERLAERQQELDERLTKGRADSLKRIGELEADYQRNREQAATAHRDTLLEAAARLDARAVWQENRRFDREEAERLTAHGEAIAKERERLAEFETEQQEAHAKAIAEEQARLQEFIDEANEAHQKRLSDERDNLNDRIKQEKDAHTQRVADAKEALDRQIADQIAANAAQLVEAKRADDQRIADMKFAHGEQQRQENEDRGLRLSRLTEDHNKQLDEMARAHGERMAQINTQEGEAKQARQDAFLLQLQDLGIYHDEWLEKQKKLEEDALKLFDAWWKEIGKRFRITPDNLPELEWPEGLGPNNRNPFEVPGGGGNPAQPGVNPGSGGGAMPVPPSPTPYAAASYFMPQPRVAVAGASNSVSVTLAQGAVMVYGAPGQSVEQLADMIDEHIIRAVRTAARSG